MNKLTIYHSKQFFIEISVWVLPLFFLCLFFDKSSLFVFVNHARISWMDGVMTFLTYLGNGWAPIVVILISLLFKQRKIACIILVSFLISSLISYLLKVGFNEARPAAYFSDPSIVKGVPWLPLAHKHSFPSGHTTTAFSFFMILCLTSRNRFLCFGYFIFACLVAYSRVYLGQHFVGDVLAGSIIGSFTAYMSILAFQGLQKKYPSLNKL